MSWLKRSVAAVKRNDPAARTTLEVLLTYPACTPCFGIACLISYIGISCFVGEDSCTILAFHNGRRNSSRPQLSGSFYRSRHGHCDWGNRGNRRRCCFVSRSDVRWDRS